MEDHSQDTAVTKSDGVVITNRAYINYILIAIIFTIVGVVIGVIGYANLDNSNEVSTAQVVATIIAQQSDENTNSNGSALTGQEVVQQAQDEILRPILATASTRQTVSTDDDPAIGPEDAPILMIEFSDFQCGYCKQFHDQTLTPLLEAYEGQIRFVYRDFLIFGNTSVRAALAAECADDQGMFWEYHDLLFANQSKLGSEMFLQLAEDLELDIGQFVTCLDEETHMAEIEADSHDASSIGALGTPAFLINGRFVAGAQSLEYFAVIIDEELAKIETGE